MNSQFEYFFLKKNCLANVALCWAFIGIYAGQYYEKNIGTLGRQSPKSEVGFFKSPLVGIRVTVGLKSQGSLGPKIYY